MRSGGLTFAPSLAVSSATSKVAAMQTSSRSLRSLRSLLSVFSARAVVTAALALAAAAPLAMDTRDAHADQDPRVAARTHYQAGQKAYAAGDYRLAIREFAAAEQLSPSGFNDYNLGLCYDKLGEADPAVRYYRSYLERVPGATNRSAVEASVARLEAALSSAASKEQARLEAERRAEEMRQAEAARRAEEERQAAAKRAEEEKAAEAKKAEEAKKAAEAKNGGKDDGKASGEPKDPGGPAEAAPDDENKISAAPTSTGDAQLDRVSSIDVASIREQRSALLGSPGTPRGAAPTGDQAVKDQGGSSSASKGSPFYKKWWFWAIVGVGTIVAIQVITQDEKATATRRGLELPPMGEGAGATLFRW